MSKNGKSNARRAERAAATILTQKDADRFARLAAAWGRKATRSKEQARKTLVSLGIMTPTGRLTKNYR